MNKHSSKIAEDARNCSTVVELLRLRSSKQPFRDAFTFLLDGETEETTLTYSQLDRRARRIAAQLQAQGLTGERALLLYPAGLDFLIAFFGCLYAGVVAVTAYPPRNKRNTPRIKAISNDAQATIALTTAEKLDTVQSLMTEKTDVKSLQWLTTDNLAPGIEDSWKEPSINKDTLAFLQYTSGSTGTPKGVMISHGNLLHNAQTTYQFMGHSPESRFVTWLPMYHDMGLIGGILQPLYGGFHCIIMPPTSFLKRPLNWLQAISKYKGTTSGGPNFAYDLCVKKITPEQKATLDLSSWSVAFNGAEPVRYETLKRFAEYFAECGFRSSAFYPCYGMAETTLMVSGVDKATSPMIKALQKSALESSRVIESSTEDEDVYNFVSCGRVIPGQKVVVANPETLKSCQSSQIGEIWSSGSSVGQGYWNREQDTQETFHAYLSDTGEGPFLRTGDLGFLQSGELFITGRAKDLIIIRGRNLYPQDIELTAERSHASLRAGASAAFTVLVNNEDKLVVVQELEFRAKPDKTEVTNAIRQAISEVHEVQAYAIVLIKPGSIPKTSSGKIQRRETRARFENDELNVVGSNILKISEIERNVTRLQRDQLLALSPRECQIVLETYLIEQEARVLSVAPDDINPEEPLTTLGLDSLKVFELKNQVEFDLEVEVSLADFFEGMSTRTLVTKILAQMTTEAFIPSNSLKKVEKAEVYPISYAQQRLWFLQRLQPQSSFYNIAFTLDIKGLLNIEALEQSFNEILQRHEALRTIFITVAGTPKQKICPPLVIKLPVVDLQHLGVGDRLTELQRITLQAAQQPFDLTTAPLLRVTLVNCSEQEYTLVLVMHHIIADGWSMGVFIHELTTLYQAFTQNQPLSLPELTIQYADYAILQRQWLDGEVLETQVSYWQKQLKNLSVLQLPIDYPRPKVQTFKGKRQQLFICESEAAALKLLSQQQGVTLFMTLLAAFDVLLHWYTNEEDIVVGTDIANRNQAQTYPLIGFFANQLVLRTNLSDNPTFIELLARVRQVTIEAYTNQYVPFDKLVEVLNPDRTLNRTPLFQVKLVLQNTPMPPAILSGLNVGFTEVDNHTAKYDLLLNLTKTEQGLTGWLEYSTDLFAEASIKRLLSNFTNLLQTVTDQPQIKLNDLKEIITQGDKQQQIAQEQELKQARLRKFQNLKRKVIKEEFVL